MHLDRPARVGSVRGFDRPSQSDADAWFGWLRSVRHGGDTAYAAALQPMIDDIRDRLLDHADLGFGQSIADIGCGDGLAGFAALERRPTSRVTFVDISPALVASTRAQAVQLGVEESTAHLVASAEDLGAIPDASIDTVLVRAVLAYLDDKRAALGECRRILRAGGRISIVDPIFQDRAFAVAGLARQRSASDSGIASRYVELLHRCRSAHFPDSLEEIARNPQTNYNERDLVRLFETAGFVNIHLRLHIDSVPALAMPWRTFLASSPYAGAPTMGDILATRFDPTDYAEFETFFRPGIEAGTTLERNVNAYIFADNP